MTASLETLHLKLQLAYNLVVVLALLHPHVLMQLPVAVVLLDGTLKFHQLLPHGFELALQLTKLAALVGKSVQCLPHVRIFYQQQVHPFSQLIGYLLVEIAFLHGLLGVLVFLIHSQSCLLQSPL